jgi:beta-lactamase class A
MFKIRQRKRTYSQDSFNLNAYNRSVHYSKYANYTVDKTNKSNRQKSRRPKFSFLFIVLLVIALGGHVIWSKHVSAEKLAAQQLKAEELADDERKENTFANQLNTLLAGNPADTLGIATASDSDGVQSYGVNSPFDGASVGKLLTAADYLRHVEEGTASLNQDIDGQTAGYWLKIMLVNSDDTAWAELNDYLTHDNLAAYADSIGFTDYDPTVNTFLPSDVAGLLQKLYSGHLLNSADRSLMLGYLSQANYRQYIVPAVPKGDQVYHKIGLDEDEVNDAAIITSGQKYLVIVIFTNGNGTYNWDARAQLMQTITKDAIAAYL